MNALISCFLENNIIIILCGDRSQMRKKEEKENCSRNENVTYARGNNHILTYTYRSLITNIE